MIRRDVVEQAIESQQNCMHAMVSCNTSFGLYLYRGPAGAAEPGGESATQQIICRSLCICAVYLLLLTKIIMDNM